jgi:hypothetical protein
MEQKFTRRGVIAATLAGAGAAGLAAAPGAATTAAANGAAVQAASASRRRAFDLTQPVDNVTAYLKLRASIETQDVYFWFTGRLDLAIPGERILPIIEVESLILRRTERVGDLAWNVTDWEAALYRDPASGAYLEEGATLLNPWTGARLKPFHYREGPVRFRFTDQEPRIVGSRDVMPSTGKPFNYPWRVVAGDLYMTKSSYIRAPNWLQPADWPAESSGKDVVVATHSTLKGRLADIENPRLASVPADFSYTATSGWLPWMLMGQAPGHVVWAESGKKLFSLDEAQPAHVAMLRKVHPQWFDRPEPWPEFTNMYLQYKAALAPKSP